MNIIRPITGVRIFEKCWTPDECRNYIPIVEKASGWRAAAMGRYQDDVVVESYVNKELRDVDVINLEAACISNPLHDINNLLETINAELDCDALRISRAMISKYTFGSHIKSHRDTGVFTTSRIATVVLYLNDDYEGGNLYFTDLKLEYRPKTGDMACFYSELRHEVRPVTRGVRYCIVAFAENDLAYQKLK